MGLLLLQGDADGSTPPAPLDMSANLWMEPESGAIGANALGDSLTLVGVPTLATGPSDRINAVTFGSGKRLTAPAGITGDPVNQITGSWWVMCFFKTTTSGLLGLFGNGGSTGPTDHGIRVTTNTAAGGAIGIVIANGGVWKSATLSAPSVRTLNGGDVKNGQWQSVLIEYRHQAFSATSSEFRSTWNMRPEWLGSSHSRAADITGISFPISAPKTAFTVGDTAAGGAFPFTGDLVVCAGAGELTAEKRWVLWNHEQFRKYTGDIDSRYAADKVKWCEATGVTSAQTGYCFRTDYPLAVKIYEASGVNRGSLIATSAIASPDAYGFRTGVFTGLTAGTKYHIVASDASGVESCHECRAETLPITDTKISVYSYGCWSANDLTPDTMGPDIGMPHLALAQTDPPKWRTVNGDEYYTDVVSADPLVHVAAVDANFAGADMRPDNAQYRSCAQWTQIQRWWMMQVTGKIGWTVSDHDGPANDEDSSSISNPAWVRYQRARNPGYTYLEDDHHYCYIDITPDISIWMFDCRSESIHTFNTGQVISATQLAHFAAWCDHVRDNSMIGFIISERCWDLGEIGTQQWNLTNPYAAPPSHFSQLKAVFDAIANSDASLGGAMISTVGDVHMTAYDSGANQGSFNTAANLDIPCWDAGGMRHGAQALKGTWDGAATGMAQGGYAILGLTNQTQPTVNFELRRMQGATTLGTHTKVRTKT